MNENLPVTVVLPRYVMNRVSALNDARNEGRRSSDRALRLRTPLAVCAGACFRLGSRLLDYEAARVSRKIETKKGFVMTHFLRFAFLAVFFLPLIAFAQASSVPVITDLPADQAVSQFVVALGGIKGASVLGVVAAITQLAMILLRSPLGSFAGKYKLLIVTGLSIVGGFIGLLVSGVSWPLALMHGTVLSAVQVFVHQLVIQLKPETKPEA